MKNNIDLVNDKDSLFKWLEAYIQNETKNYFGLDSENWSVKDAIQYFYSYDDESQKFRFIDLEFHGVTNANTRGIDFKILDMASGFGQFVISALNQGFNCWGLEPGQDRLDFVSKKIEVFGLPQSYKERFIRGGGENMPFMDNSFDYITSFQTMEHVQDIEQVCLSLIRVIRNGGGIHIRCPSYAGTFEGHYHLPLIPFSFTKKIYKVFLSAIGRPIEGIDQQVNYITQRRLLGAFYKAASLSDARIYVADCLALKYESGLRRRGLPVFPGMVGIVKAVVYFKCLFRAETNIDIFIRVIKPS